jgi:hypothetical protein
LENTPRGNMIKGRDKARKCQRKTKKWKEKGRKRENGKLKGQKCKIGKDFFNKTVSFILENTVHLYYVNWLVV